MKRSELARQQIVDAAISLFNTKGYNGTTVRDISAKANVNVATISYYFNGKNGLLEHCFITFFENYLKELEEACVALEQLGANECLKKAIKQIMNYQYEHLALSRFVWREVSIDTQMIREIMSTYLMKERYLLKSIFDYGIREKTFRPIPTSISVIQLKSMMTMPFLNAHYHSEVWNVYLQDTYYFERYTEHICDWVDNYLVDKNNQKK